MRSIEIKSSNIKALYYFEDKNILYVFFHSGYLYLYDCTIEQYNKFVSSKDKSEFFNKHFRVKPFIKKY